MEVSYGDMVIFPREPQYAANRFKILVVGRKGSGRSALVRRFKHNEFHEIMEDLPLPEITVVVRAVRGDIVKADLQIMELSNFVTNDDPSNLAKVHIAKHCLDVNGLLLVYDTTSQETFEEICNALPSLQRMIAPDVDICLVGTKADLSDAREISFVDAEKKSQALGFSLFETSAVTGINCEELILEILDKLSERRAEVREYLTEKDKVCESLPSSDFIP
ncbi:hypothetical protein Y032_0148g2650 [Ancylostoma ceylanicum]|uniref:Ras family protein n=1 Tax=Ancylostoma ceylanicum TaxID=53326 RepID=A0A016T201_9BILA|nr:hypothetical protein Y032_0148g2650 [Ancylostoma ceylanicum]